MTLCATLRARPTCLQVLVQAGLDNQLGLGLTLRVAIGPGPVEEEEEAAVAVAEAAEVTGCAIRSVRRLTIRGSMRVTVQERKSATAVRPAMAPGVYHTRKMMDLAIATPIVAVTARHARRTVPASLQMRRTVWFAAKYVDHVQTLAVMVFLIKLARRFALRSQSSMAEALVRSRRALTHQAVLEIAKHALAPLFAAQSRVEHLLALLAIPRRVRFQLLERSATFARTVTTVTVPHQTPQNPVTATAVTIAAFASFATLKGSV